MFFNLPIERVSTLNNITKQGGPTTRSLPHPALCFALPLEYLKARVHVGVLSFLSIVSCHFWSVSIFIHMRYN